MQTLSLDHANEVEDSSTDSLVALTYYRCTFMNEERERRRPMHTCNAYSRLVVQPARSISRRTFELRPYKTVHTGTDDCTFKIAK